MKKVNLKKAVIATLAVATVLTTGAAIAVSASAENVATSSYTQVMEETFDKSSDSAAPNVNKEAFEKTVSNKSEVGMYNIKEGKYYVIKTIKKVPKKVRFGDKSIRYDKVAEYHLVKVERAFEDSRWWGSERTIDVRFCESGATQRIQPDKWFVSKIPFYEIDDCIC